MIIKNSQIGSFLLKTLLYNKITLEADNFAQFE